MTGPMRVLGLAFALACCGEIIDRVAVTVDSTVITQSDILRDIRLAALLNGEKPDTSPESKRKAAGRLIEQALVRHEMDFTRFQQPAPSEAATMLKQVIASRFHGSESAYRAALQQYGVTDQQVRAYLLRQVALLRFINMRFGPEVQVSEAEVRNYYENEFLPECHKQGKCSPEPSLDDVQNEIEQTLTEQRVDKLVDEWVRESRKRAQITFREDAFE